MMMQTFGYEASVSDPAFINPLYDKLYKQLCIIRPEENQNTNLLLYYTTMEELETNVVENEVVEAPATEAEAVEVAE